MLAAIRALDKKFGSVMLIGYNPLFTDLAHRLSSEVIDMPNSTVVEFNFDTESWSDAGEIRPAKVAAHGASGLPNALPRYEHHHRCRNDTRRAGRQLCGEPL